MVRFSLSWSRRTRLLALCAVVAVLLAGGVHWFRPTADTAVRTTEEMLHVPEAPGSDERIAIDTTLFVPESATGSAPAPAVLLAHGFGGDKTDLAEQARDLAQRGLVVLTYSARGFGRSGGTISMNHPDFEVADASRLVDHLATLDSVELNDEGDPRVGVSGASYGGALSLLLAGTDDRIDVVAPVITYNDLASALLPNAAGENASRGDTPATGADAPHGVFKKAWGGMLFAAGSAGAADTASAQKNPNDSSAGGGTTDNDTTDSDTTNSHGGRLRCGRFSTNICRAYRDIALDGAASQDTLRLLHSVSPSAVTDNIDIPTLLVQGTQDTLFGLEQADANARQISEAGGEVEVVWFPGGHGSADPGEHVTGILGDWLVEHLSGDRGAPRPGFTYGVPGPVRDRDEDERNIRWVTAPSYPGLGKAGDTNRDRVRLRGPKQRIMRPAGATPSAVSGLPSLQQFLGNSSRLAGRISIAPPDQSARFTTAPLEEELLVTGTPRVTLRIARDDTARDDTDKTGTQNSGNVLFAKLYDVDPDGNATLPAAAVSPFRLPDLPEDGSAVEVTVALPGIAHAFEQDHSLRLVIGTTDQAYAVPDAPAQYDIALARQSLSVPAVAGETTGQQPPLGQALGIVGVLVAGMAVLGVARLRRRRGDAVDTAAVNTPLRIDGLTKSYRGGLTAVDGLSLHVSQGQVLGLLGPNGAGKTTTLRMLLGLVRPTSGEIRVFGHRIRPGAPVLSRLGTFVEGAGFLPHMSGMDNLRLYWASTGRATDDAHLDQVLEIAGLGDAVHRRVRTYSQGMRQRLAIAQAMLGLPELLVLDEPTNGLDPPQIHQMREVLLRYAATGRTVVISSHLLAEVEQTCTHVVVMHRGALVTSGAVDEVVSAGAAAAFRVDRPDAALETLRTDVRASQVHSSGDVVYAELGTTPRSTAVAALVHAGIAVEHAGPRRRLEDTFLQLVGEENEQ